jgi:hypothetical protein
MRTDAYHPARVRDPAIELLLSHTASVTAEWCSRRRARRQPPCASARSDQPRSGSTGSDWEFAALCGSDADQSISRVLRERITELRFPIVEPEYLGVEMWTD